MKNYYFLNPGEFFVSQQLAKKRPELRLYFPLRDQGCDLLAVDEKASRIVKIQVKESRAYPKKGRSWHQLKKGKIEAADIFVFVTYVPGSQAKFWLAPARFRKNKGFKKKELRKIAGLIEQNQERLMESWDEYFNE
jgi:hypothetical protein